MRDFDISRVRIYTTANGVKKIQRIVIININTCFFENFKAGIMNIRNLIICQNFKLTTF